MAEWWNSLLLEKQVFYALGGVALAVLLMQMVLTVLGFDSHHGDVDSGGQHDSGLGIVSIRTVAAFFVGFGWTGAIMLNKGFSTVAAIAGGTAVGALFLLLTYFLIWNLLRLQSSGNLEYKNAIGAVGTVYTTIPAAESGGGQVEVLIQGRLAMAEAYTKANHDLKPGTKARVVDLVGETTLMVEPLHDQSSSSRST